MAFVILRTFSSIDFFFDSSSAEKRRTASDDFAARGAARVRARAGAEQPLEVVPAGLLDDVPDLREVALADAPDLDVGRAALRVEPGPVDGGPHVPLARSSSSVMTAEWSRPPRPRARSAAKSSCTSAVVGSGTPNARPDSMIRPRSLKWRSTRKPGW